MDYTLQFQHADDADDTHDTHEQYETEVTDEGYEVAEEETEEGYEEEDYEEEPEEPSSRPTGWIVAFVLAVLVAGAGGYGAYHFRSQHLALQTTATAQTERLAQLEALRAQLEEQLGTARASLEASVASQGEADSQLEELRGRIARQQRELSSLRSYRNQATQTAEFSQKLTEAEAKNAELTAEIATYQQQMASMREERTALAEEIEGLKTQKADLMAQIKSASGIRGYSMIVEATEEKKGDFIFTPRAKKADRLSMSFVLGANQFAQKGEKTVHLIITDPEGEVLSMEGERKFSDVTNRTERAFSRTKAVNYQGQDEKVFFNYDEDRKYTAGDYLFEIFVDGAPMVSETLTLR